nr:hypothetical protein [uncultured bacterium]
MVLVRAAAFAALLDLRAAGAVSNRSRWEEGFFFLVADLAIGESIWDRGESFARHYAIAACGF